MNADSSDARLICEQVIIDGVVSSDEVSRLSQYVDADRVVGREEAEWLLRVNAATRHNRKNCTEWPDFFISTITRFIVFDMNTSGEVASDEAAWLLGHFPAGESLSETECGLFREIRRMAPRCCASLNDYFAMARPRAHPKE